MMIVTLFAVRRTDPSSPHELVHVDEWRAVVSAHLDELAELVETTTSVLYACCTMHDATQAGAALIAIADGSLETTLLNSVMTADWVSSGDTQAHIAEAAAAESLKLEIEIRAAFEGWL